MQLAETSAERPLANVSDAHLATLGNITAARQNGPEPNRLSGTNAAWNERLHGNLTEETLQERIRAAENALATDTVINNPNKLNKATWLHESLQSEHAIRTSLDDETRRSEAFERGAHTHKDTDAPEADRHDQRQTIASRIQAEQRLRTMLPDQPPAGAQRVDVLPEWMAPAASITAGNTPQLFSSELVKRRAIMDTEMIRRGREIPEQQPTWAADLGPTPSDSLKQQQWVRLAAEVDTYRAKYNITDTDTDAIPSRHRDSQTGEDLAARVTAMHKHTALTTKKPFPAGTMTEAAINAEGRSQAETGLTEAEQVAETLRQKRAETTEHRPGQDRDAKIADQRRAAIAKLQADTAKRRNTAGQQTEDVTPDKTPVVSEAQRKIDRYEAERNAQERHRRDQNESRQTHDRGPTIGR